MKTLKHLARVTGIALAVSTAFSPFGSNADTLEQAVAKTLDTHPELRVVFNRFKAREAQIDQAVAGYLPNVEISAGWGIENTDSPSTRRNPLNGATIDDRDTELKRGEAGISIRQMLFDGFLTSSEVDRATFEATAEQWTLAAAAEDMALEVARVYLAYIQAEQVLTLAKKNLQTHKGIYGQIKQRTDSGLGSSADLSHISGRLARANANVIAAHNNLYDTISEYKNVTGQAPKEVIIPVADEDMLPSTLAQTLLLAQENHPVLKSASQDIEAAQSEQTAAKSSFYPTINIELSGNWNNDLNGENGRSFNSDVGGHSNDLQAMIRMRYNLFSGGGDAAKHRETSYRIAEAKEIRERAHRQINEGANLAWNAYELLPEQKLFIREHVVAAKETQLAYAQQFNLGQRSLLDLLDTENELFEARKDYLRAEFDELLAQYRVLNATGQLLNSLRVSRPEAWSGETEYEGGAFK
ncbi:MAG: TolC family outer membrane protein [Shewanella sp.]|nr:TolC family outer membrane protein [Shewanella sp.]MCF1431622.1 TolC family outer membrane protein [Shewanella sp.]MCF1437894.1 TolC family outer membrane protein [Shewanella sp.]MCF1457175.1 TolC family outer membrane protein [Shewanella sp.]